LSYKFNQMNSKLYKFTRLLENVPLDWFIRFTGKRDILPFYHAVSDEDVIHIKHLYNVRSSKAFEKDLDFFLKHYTPVNYKSFKNRFDNSYSKKENTFLLTFDDGLREFHDIIAPILVRKGIPAICFLNSGFIDNKNLFYRYKTSILIEKLMERNTSTAQQKEINDWFLNKNLSLIDNYKSLCTINYANRHYIDELAGILDVDFNEYLQTVKPYMDSIQIQSLIKQGFEFGAHSIDHPQFSELKTDQQIAQFEESVNEIIKTFDLDYRIFSFPFTDFGVSMDFFNTVFDKNATKAELSFGCAGLKKDSCSRNIQRIAIEKDNLTAQDIIYYEYIYSILKSAINKNTIKRN